MKKFKVVCQWTSDFEIYNRFIRNYITEGNFNPNFIITYNDDYDYLIVFNRCFNPSQIKCSKENVIGFIMEPSWSNSWDRNIGSYCGKVYFHDVWLLERNTPFIENFESHPAMMLYHMDKDPINKYLNNTFNKTKKMSFIVSNGQVTDDNVILYGARARLAKQILESDLPIDIYGRGWTDKHDQRIKGPLDNKSDGLIDYEYSIAVENTAENNYLTEKFIDCLLCDTVPVYYGAPNAHKIYDDSCYIDLCLNSDTILLQLQNIIEKDNYKKRVDILTKMKLSYYKNYNIYTKIQEIFN